MAAVPGMRDGRHVSRPVGYGATAPIQGCGWPHQRGRRSEDCMKFQWHPAVAASILVLGTMPGHAAATIDQYVNFSGFGTLGEVYSDYRQADFTGEFLQPRGAGFSRSWSPTPDSDLGGQADVRIVDGLTGVVQVIARDNQ